MAEKVWFGESTGKNTRPQNEVLFSFKYFMMLREICYLSKLEFTQLDQMNNW